jgi:hypothetical protein
MGFPETPRSKGEALAKWDWRQLLVRVADDVALIGGDRRIYIGQAKDQRAKSFQRIDVSSTVIGTGATRVARVGFSRA